MYIVWPVNETSCKPESTSKMCASKEEGPGGRKSLHNRLLITTIEKQKQQIRSIKKALLVNIYKFTWSETGEIQRVLKYNLPFLQFKVTFT